ncbi:hypothetical protein PZBJ_13905 [Pantoea endophytica]|uniref:Uncharacterized protein n=1 Tax=Pantoea endophytica TaxID=92488 RepID=A0ABX4SPU1_9GAMM|nr:DUF3226 domain-containing protein [Pantoea endophytica]PLR23200.1 hypothetical protein PZBJ_13905 [Pantoea endophytica]
MNSHNKVVVVACEGQHDIAFITRILQVAGFVTKNDKIKNFPMPFNILFRKIAESMVLTDRKLGYQSPNYLLPCLALEKENSIVFLHNLSGDGRQDERSKLVKAYSELKGDDDFTKDLGYSFKFLFFFDADEEGVPARLNSIKEEFNLSVTPDNGIILPYNDHEIGCYVYHEKSSETGVLEDILLEHFSNKDEHLMGCVSEFLSQNALESERTKEMHIIEGCESRKGKSKYSEKKSKINLFGQLQFSGMNNSVIISKSDFLRKSDIDSCPQCIRIKEMF